MQTVVFLQIILITLLPLVFGQSPYSSVQVFQNPSYASEIQLAASSISDPALLAKANAIIQFPTFVWLDSVSKLPLLNTTLQRATIVATKSGVTQLVQVVLYDLPDKNCAARATPVLDFTAPNNGQAGYMAFIDQIAALVAQYPKVRVVTIVEPYAVASLVLNLNVAKCASVANVYKVCIQYALSKLAAAGVYLYIDAGHAGNLGWPANIMPAAQLLYNFWVSVQKSPLVRGIATNVAGYNAYKAPTPDPITQGNPNYDEWHYIQTLLADLHALGWTNATAIVEQSRSGQQNIRSAWSNWCNINKAGFGIRPTSDPALTGSLLVDAIVWAKNGGESDGTSSSASPRYDPSCATVDAATGAPDAGAWFQSYFTTLLANANPPL